MQDCRARPIPAETTALSTTRAGQIHLHKRTAASDSVFLIMETITRAVRTRLVRPGTCTLLIPDLGTTTVAGSVSRAELTIQIIRIHRPQPTIRVPIQARAVRVAAGDSARPMAAIIQAGPIHRLRRTTRALIQARAARIVAGDVAPAEAIIPDDRIRRRQRTILVLLRGAMIADGRCQAAVTVVRRILTVAAARQAAIGSREVGDVLTRRPVRRVRHWI